MILKYSLIIFKIQFITKKSMQSNRNCVVCAHSSYQNVCKHCGIYIHANHSLKTSRFSSEFYSSHEKFLKHLKQRNCKVLSYTKQLSQATISLLQSICEKFQFKLGTLALGIYYYQLINQETKNQTNQFVQIDSQQPFQTSVCLIAAGKAIQLDKKVPYLDRYQRYADKTKTQQQYQAKERYVCQKLNFDMQFSTFVNFLNYYMTLGIVFASDKIGQQRVYEIEDEIIYKAQQLVFKGRFAQYDPNELAMKIISETRAKFKLSPWCSELQIITATKNQNKNLITPKKPIQETLKFSNFYPNSKTKTQVKKLVPKVGSSNCKQNRQKSISGYSSVKNFMQKSTAFIFDWQARLKSKNSQNQAQTQRENLKVKRL